VLTLRSAGIHDAVALRGGLDAWQAAGYPVDTGQPGEQPSAACAVCGQVHPL
jgi:3-mercaptopyruvate sulfurtransferase SseA